MARKPRRRPLTQVKPGDVYALPLEDGRWGVCRVLRRKGDPPEALVVTSAWIGDTPPGDLTDPLLRTPLVLTHHSWSGVPNLSWVSEPLPADAVPLGSLPLKREERSTTCATFSGWEAHRVQVLLQWRWDHEREAVQADEQEAQVGYRPLPVGLEELRRRKPFPNWTGYPAPAEIRLSRRIVRDLLDELIALGQDGDEAEKLDAFRGAVERFNQTDFIETVEREDICEALEEIAEAAGLGDYDVTDSRDW